jgi:hypothetical protein
MGTRDGKSVPVNLEGARTELYHRVGRTLLERRLDGLGVVIPGRQQRLEDDRALRDSTDGTEARIPHRQPVSGDGTLCRICRAGPLGLG